MPQLLNVSNRLPVTVHDDGSIKSSSGGLVTALEGLSREAYSLRWVGWPGAAVPPERQGEVRRILSTEYNASAVFLSHEEVRGFYEGFSNASLWPILHYMPSKMCYDAAWWEQYRTVNQHFADTVLAEARDGDMVWVHDYQLMLVPEMLKSAMPSLRVGFFLHTPFPSYEIFRILPRRSELLSGVLAADLVGFHTFGYLRHFRSSVLRLLGLDADITRIRREGHIARMAVYPIGINATHFEQELSSPEFPQHVAKLREAYPNKRLVVSVERMDYTKGILHRLDAIDLFLADFQDQAARDAIKFIFVSIPSRENVEEYQALRQEVESRVGRINGKYATLNSNPIHFIHGTVNFHELCALYAASEVALVAPLIDGMNLVAKEFVACQTDNPGVLILSEFAGAAEELFSAVMVNPYDARAFADALAESLAMPIEQRRARMEPMRERVMRFDANWWARRFITDLKSVHDEPEPVAAPIREAGVRLSDALAAGGRVALFLDYDGTLREIEREPGAARPTPAVLSLIDTLTALPHVDVTVISGRRLEDLAAFFDDRPLSLIAEHGASIRPAPGQPWEQLDRNVDFTWKQDLRAVLRVYVDSTPGSFIEEKRTSLVWHYRRADPEFGSWKASQLAAELATLTANKPLEVRHGRKIVEITSEQINKGAAVLHFVDTHDYALVLCAGDDTTDESMFRLNLPNLLTIKVGDGDSTARYRLPTPLSFRQFLLTALTNARSQQLPVQV